MTDPRTVYNVSPPPDVHICYEPINGKHVVTVLVPEVIANWLHRNMESKCVQVNRKEFATFEPAEHTRGFCDACNLRLLGTDARPGLPYWFEYEFKEEDMNGNFQQTLGLYKKFLTDFGKALPAPLPAATTFFI
jgi:hypothetical protein